jgi:hypothetical protein
MPQHDLQIENAAEEEGFGAAIPAIDLTTLEEEQQDGYDKTTPRKQYPTKLKVDCYPETPVGAAADTYKFHCPICMMYFKDVFQTACCKHSICANCAMFHIHTKLRQSDAWGTTELPEDSIPTEKLPIACPHCNTEGVQFLQLTALDQGRNYAESPAVVVALNKKRSFKNHTPVRSDLTPKTPLPIVGDTADGLEEDTLLMPPPAARLAFETALGEANSHTNNLDKKSHAEPEDGDFLGVLESSSTSAVGVPGLSAFATTEQSEYVESIELKTAFA